MRVFARLVPAPLLFLFMAVSPLSAQGPSAAETSPVLHPTALHPDGLPSSPLMVSSSSLEHVHVGILWSPGVLVSTQFSFGTFDRHHRHGVTHMHRHPPGVVVIIPRHRVLHHGFHHRAWQHDAHRWRHMPRHSGRDIRRHDGVKFGTPGRIHSPAVDIGPRRFERERLTAPRRGVERHHFQRRAPIRSGIEPQGLQRREDIRGGVERHHFRGRGMQ